MPFNAITQSPVGLRVVSVDINQKMNHLMRSTDRHRGSNNLNYSFDLRRHNIVTEMKAEYRLAVYSIDFSKALPGTAPNI